MENKSHAMVAGVFVVAVAALLVALAVWLTRDNSEKRVYEISSREGVTGLQPQAGVRYKGVLVGRVSSIALDEKTAGNVLVRISVNENAPVSTTTFATLGFVGVTGLAFVQLDDADGTSQPLETSATQVARIPMRAGLVSRLTAQSGQLLGQLEQISERTNALLAAENQKKMMAAVDSLGQAAAGIHTLTQRADHMLTPKPGEEPINLPRVLAQAQGTLQNVKTATERLGASADAVRTSAVEFREIAARVGAPDGPLDRITQGTETLLPRINRTTDEAARTVRQMGRIADAVNESPQSLLWGKGATQPGPGEAGFVAPPTR